ncbi:MAG: medium chain dehydrogenase/reductase family protein [Spirochaetales bacterium]|nr:medium chain dehydrogenase/reductase family protein [Spirochaetales bacterium]
MQNEKIIITKFGGPEVLKKTTEKNLPIPGEKEVRIRVLARSAAFTDTLIRRGKYPGVKKKPPFTPGYDMVGTVDTVGRNTTDFKQGQMVAALTVIGSYAEYMCLPETQLVPVPEGLDPAEAVSLVLSYVTAYQMIHRSAELQTGQSILVHGAGGAVGTALLQLGKIMDLSMFGTASAAKHDAIRRAGAMPIDYRQEDFTEVIRREKPEGLNAVFDAIGGKNFKRSFKCLKKGGKLVTYGFYKAAVEKGGWTSSLSIPLDIMRPYIWNILPNGRSAEFYSIKQNQQFREDLLSLFKLLKAGDIKPLIAEQLPLDQAAKAHRLIDKAAVTGKIILT